MLYSTIHYTAIPKQKIGEMSRFATTYMTESRVMDIS